jgi:acyl phosphate:glycerol-3-phosphate acyltransferase
MPSELFWFLALALAYLLGAIPFGLWVGKAVKGIDLREHGSGNLGATNALRILGKPLGGLVLLLDAGKGLLPVLAFPWLLNRLELAPPTWLPAAVAAAAVLGHVFPIYLRFKGGKGVATSAGAFGALNPPAFGVALVVFASITAATRFVSLGSIVAALALPTATIALADFAPERSQTILFLVFGLLIIVRHRTNLSRLLKGRENRLGAKAGSAPPEASVLTFVTTWTLLVIGSLTLAAALTLAVVWP